jgi:membrane-bound serine protease (ClpP class)
VRRLPIVGVVLAICGLILALFSPLMVPAASAVAPATGQVVGGQAIAGQAVDPGVIDVVKVDGLLDPVMADFMLRSIDEAQAVDANGLVLQVDSRGSVLSDDDMATLIDAITTSTVPVAVWIGPSGGSALGASALLAGHAEAFGMAPGTSWGLNGVEVPPSLLEGTNREVPAGVVGAQELEDQTLPGVMSPTIGDLIVDLPGMVTREVEIDGETRLEPVTPVRFSQLPLVETLMHAVASPAVAYLLLVVGMALLIFELFTAGVGVAGGVAAGSLVLGSYGLAVLPLHVWALAMLVASMLAFTIDVQTGVPRAWTAVGMVLFVVGSVFLYDGVSMSWITLAVAIVGVALTFYTGIPSMVRTRFATPTIGRDWMIGELGRAITDISPDGVVQIRQALWRATTNRATPIEELDQVRVVGIDGLVLEVEPEEGGARDYRERARGTTAPAPDAATAGQPDTGTSGPPDSGPSGD